jgi:hypothetical protein
VIRTAAAFAAVAVLLGAPDAARAQGPRDSTPRTAASELGWSRLRVSHDNDALDVWLAPWYRPDEEYTGGVRAEAERPGAAWWRRLIGTAKPPCANRRSDPCATRTFAFGQQIYTAARHIGDTGVAPGSRPNAGWLYLEETERIVAPLSLTAFTVTVGVTGEPALASTTQRVAHGYAAAYNRPIDWSRQVPFEPGVDLTLLRTGRIPLSAGTAWSLDVLPRAGVRLGTVHTDATAGVAARASWPGSDPFLAGAMPRGFQVELQGGGDVRGVARNAFLDGTLFSPSVHVAKRPVVGSWEGALTVRYQRGALTYRAHGDGPEHMGRTGPHVWGSVQAEWRLR